MSFKTLPAPKTSPIVALIVLSIFTFVVSLGFLLYLILNNNFNAKKAEFITYNTDQVVVAINLQRKQNSLPPLIINEKLAQAAQNKAKDLSGKSYFSHIEPIGGKRWSDFIMDTQYNYAVAGENLANGFYDTKSMVTAWMNSPSHRENILNDSVKETGIGISSGNLKETPTIFVVQMFGLEE